MAQVKKFLRRCIDYLLDTLVTNCLLMIVVIPFYIAIGMPWEGLEKVIFAFFTIGWIQSFPIPIVLRWFRRKVEYLEVKIENA